VRSISVFSVLSNLSLTTPGSRFVDKREIAFMGRDVIKGLVLLEGSFPVDHLNPALKHLVHYGRQTGMKGLLDWYSMFVFERNNKRVKSLVKHTAQPLSSLANNVERILQARRDTFAEKTPCDFESAPAEKLSVRFRMYRLSQRQKHDMEMWGVTSFLDVKTFKVASVLGVHFRTGQWGCRRCASVITTIHRGISRYCIVNAFFMVQDKAYAAITWLSTPIYPCHPFKIVVKMKLMTPARQLTHQSVISVDRIQPCTISVMPASDGVHFYMLRGKGTDRTVAV